MSKWLYRSNAVALFLVSLFVILAAIDEILQNTFALIVFLLLFIISLSSGIYFLRTNEKSRLLKASAILITTPILAMVLIAISVISIFGLSGPADSIYVLIWLSLILILLAVVLLSGFITFGIHLLKKKKKQ